ncbi:MAG: helix-turn-helix transcriptional regulator [Armatimonadia bacterium]
MTPNELKAELKALGLNQSDFAAMTGRTRACVSQWCNGRRAMPEDEVRAFLRMEKERQARVTRRTRMEEANDLQDQAARLLKQARRTLAAVA